jgi:septum formation protein
MSLVVASASPRRHELLAALGLEFAVVPSGVDEVALARGRPPADAVLAIAVAKGRAAARPDAVVLAADTMVVLGDVVLGKPADEAEARAMLAALRDRRHRVLTGVSVSSPADEAHTVVESEVHMRAYRDDEIAAYVATGDGRDKAGGYAIQHETFRPVDAIAGCWCNVMGLPLWTVYGLLRAAGLVAPRRPDAAYPRCGACPLARAYA